MPIRPSILAIPTLESGLDPLLLDRLTQPADEALDRSMRDVRRSGAFDDPMFVRCGVRRVIGQSDSGRDFLQQYREVFDGTLARATFFDSLHSKHRRDLLTRLNTEVVRRGRVDLPDLLAGFPELKGRAVFAVDGHHVEHATHSPRNPKGDFVSSNVLHVLCLHTSLLLNSASVQGDGIYRHEMPVFRDRIADWLPETRRGRPGPKPIFVADPAFVDSAFWTRMQIEGSRGAQVITRTKKNMKPIIYAERRIDRSNPVNEGVVADLLVGFDGGCTMRIVRYRDPETGAEYEFLTTVDDLAPGLIAVIYLLRWRIEKVFDTAKNKLGETKAWAVGEVAREIHSNFLALTHNLAVLLRNRLGTDEGIREEKVERKREEAMEIRETRAKANGAKVAFIQSLMPVAVQLTAQFIRTLRNGIMVGMRWLAAVKLLRAAMKAYL